MTNELSSATPEAVARMRMRLKYFSYKSEFSADLRTILDALTRKENEDG